MAEAVVPSVASNLVSKLGEYLFAPIGRQFGYVLCYKCYIEDLENGVKKVEHARKRVQSSVDEAMNDGKLIHADVKDWLESLEDKAKEAENLLKHGASAKNDCFRGWLPNPMVRHPIGKKVKKMTQVIQELHEKSQNNNFLKVYYENPPIGIVTAITPTARSVDNKQDVLESRAKITEEVIKAIVDDKVCVLGVWGVGGVGKSKLLEEVERRVKHEKMFDEVVMANVSRNLDLKRIQGEIAYALGLKLMNEETTRGRADLLCKRIERDHNKSILIILDNLWKKLDLKEVGIPCGDNNKVKCCKLLITSRYRDVLRNDMSSDREVQLNKLEHGEARKLFERTLGDRVGDRVNHLEFIDGVVKNCGGLPLLIVSLAKRLKHGDLAAWRIASNNIDASDVKSLVELTYNDLKDERIKSLFLICALNSGRICLRDSFMYCMGLGLFEKFSNTIENARDRLIVDLHSLQDSSLLLDSGDMEWFRMHDIFVDAAISISSIEWNALVGRKDFGFKEWSNDKLRKCTAIFILFVDIDELPEKLDCPNLRMLVLGEHNPSLKVPELFFESMTELQVLDFTGLFFTSLPSSIEFLENLKSLYLFKCHLKDVTVLGKLKGLQFLDLGGSTIALLPEEIGELTKLRLLNLTSCTKLKVIKPGVLGSLVNLEELYMEDGFDQWEAEDEAPRSNASLAELKNMKKLSTLYIAIPHYTKLSRDLPFGKLNKHKIHIGYVWDWWGEYRESRTLKLKLDSSNLLIEEWMLSCLQKTQDLHLDGLRHGVDSIRDLCIEGFQELKHLHIQNSPSLQNVVYSIGNVKCTTFTGLESLFLKNLNNLKKICHGCLALESFSKLKILKVDNCGEIKHLFPLSIKRTILQLEEIEISRCHLMQQIVADAEADEDGDEIYDDAKVKLCNLRRLTLRNLPEMMSFCKTADHSIDFFNGQQVSLPRLESLTLCELPKMKEIWNSQFPSDVSTLKFLKVEDCAFLMSIFPSNLVIKLQDLEAITIERCQFIRKVFDLEGPTTSGDVKILKQLTTLTLSDLPRLEHIWNKNPRIALCFPKLRVLKVQGCENMRFIFSSSMAKALQQIKEIKIARCKLLEKIMDVQEEESKKATSLYTLKLPLLSSLSLEELPNLRTFSHGTHYIQCPTLTRLRISGCPKMMTFSSFEGKQQMITANTGLQQAFGGVNSSLSLPILFDQNVLLPRLEELTVMSCGLMKIWHNELSEESFCKLASITIQNCENLSHIFPSNIIEVFQSLKRIEVINCTSLESLMERVAVNTKKMPKSLVFSNLNKVKLWDLPRLDALVTSSSQATLSLPSLTTVNLRNCHNLRYLFTYDTSGTLVKLEMLDVSDCNKMQEVVAMEESQEQKLKAVKFSCLRTLRLWSLKSLISFSSGSCAFEFPSLTNLSILECIKLKAFILRLPMPRVETTNEGTPGSDESPPSLFDEKVLLPRLEELTVVSCGLMKIWHNELSEESFCKLASVTIQNCENLSHIFPSNMIEVFQSLKRIEVINCTSLESLMEHVTINTKKMPKSVVFLDLNEVKLWDLPRLDALVTSSSQATLSLPNLTYISLRNCHSLGYLFTYDTSRTLDKLKMLDVFSCNKMQEVVAMEESEEQNLKAVKFSRLHTLKLCSLKSLISFSSTSCAFEFPSLRNLSILECTELNAFILRQRMPRVEMINEGSAGFDESSHSLFDEKLIRLQNLEAITVERCQLIREVFDLEELTTSGDVKILWQLTRLTLSGLPRLECIWNKNPRKALCFQNLKALKVQNCEGLRFLFSSTMAKALVQIKEIEIASCALLEEILYVQEEELEEAMTTDTVEFPLLTSLSLEELPNLKIFSYGKYYIHCPSLTRLTISECPKMMTFSSFKGRQQSMTAGTGLQQASSCINSSLSLPGFFNEKVLFPSLEELKLSSMCQLKRIWHNQLQGQSFCKLAALTIELCENLSHIFWSNSMDMLQSLNKIKVVGCPSLEALFEPISLSAEKRQKPLILPALRELMFLNLSRLRDILKSDYKVILAFPSLMEVKVRDCHGLPYLFSSATAKTLDKLVVLDVSCCNNLRGIIAMEEGKGKTLETLKFHQLSTIKLDDLENLISFHSESCASDGLHPLFDEKVLFPSLEELKLSSMCQLKKIWHNQIHGQSFCKLASLTIKHCENLSHVFLSNIADRLPSLNKFEVVGCPSLKALFEPVSLSSEKRQKPLVLLALREMTLLNLSRLRDILKSDCKVTLAFPSLMEVNVRRCHSLSYLFSSATAKTLHELAVLDVSCCNNLRSIIEMEEGKGKTVEAFKFPHLTKLKLDDLKSLICFSLESCAGDGLHPLFDEKLAFPKLEELHIEGVQQKEIWNDKIHVESFCLLKVLKVKQCHNLMNVIPSSMWKRLLHYMESLTIEKCQCLRNLFTISMAKSLGQLQYLGLGGCGEIEYIVAKEEEKPEEATEKIIIPQLVTLYLHNMPKLRSFYQGKHISIWPSLKEFTIEDCKAVKVILGDVSCRKLESSVPTHQPLLLIEKVEFPAMESMKILHMENMEKIWLDDLDSNAFGKLKTLVVEHCKKLLSIFSSYNMLMRFQNLEKITVTDCGSLEVVFQVQEFEFSEACSTNSFQLEEIVSTRLPKMKHVWNGLPRGGLTFGRLQCMEVIKCESLKSLFPSLMAKTMTQFKELLVSDCGVEEIIAEKDGVGMSANDLFFPQLTDLRLLELPKLGSFYRNSHTSAWPLLKQLRVRHCGKMRSFLFACELQGCQGTTTSDNQSTLFSFEKVIPHLEGLTLSREDVAMIPQHYVFHNLKELTLACYHDKNVAFPSNFLLRRFPNLEELVVRCSSFEEIFPEDSFGHGGATPCGELTDMAKPLQELRNLKQLDLYNLCNLKRVWKDGSLMAEILKHIEILFVEDCPSLSIVLPSLTSFQRLRQLEVEDCTSLVHMGTCSAVTSLVQLTWLTLRNCGAMEDVVTDDGNGEENISFPKLEELILDGLPILESFSPTNRAFRFPSLVHIVITKCPKMNIFCMGALRTPELDKVLLSEEDDEGHWEGDLNTTIQTLSTLNDPQ